MGMIVDCFAGGGGASTGIEAAMGRTVNVAINHSPVAVAMHTVNHPETKHFCEDIWAVAPRDACGSNPVDVAWFSPDCFPAGTLVLTREGYRPIEQVVVGDTVLSHTGQWRRVTNTMTTTRALLCLRGHGHPRLMVSAEHPFYARQRKNLWNNEAHRYDRTLGPASWVRAGDLGTGWYWATPTAFPAASVPAVPAYRGRTTPISNELLWLAGRYIADGWTRITETRAELVITCGNHEIGDLREKLAAWTRKGGRCGAGEIAWHERATSTAYQFTADHRGLVEWLREHFGHGAAAKRIPGWALGMDFAYRTALIEGYLSGDGWRGRNTGRDITECTTVSKALAFGIKALAASLGKTVTVAFRATNGSGFIQGRAVNTLPAWNVRWRNEVDPQHRQTWREDGLEWAPIRESTPGDTAEVFNLSVDEDESYIVEGIVVHNCTHFSRAKGSQPRSNGVRALANIVIEWARDVRPRVIFLENVSEFQTWGPLDDTGQPIKARAGEDFRAWLAALVDLGYHVEYRLLVAADHGTPTSRKRLFLVARRDGLPIVWPEPSHGQGRTPWRTAAEVIDWSLKCPSIFGRKRPLAPATLRRVAAGLRRYVLEAGRPFIVPVTHTQGGNRVHSIDTPLRTVTTAKGGELALVTPYLSSQYGQSVGRRVDAPVPTITANFGGHHALIAHTLVQTGYGEREGQAPRCLDLGKPLGTVVSGQKHGLVAAFLAKHYGGVVGHGVDRPIGTVTAVDHHSLVTAFVTKFYNTNIGCDARSPIPTITSRGQHLGAVQAALTPVSPGRHAEVRALLAQACPETGDDGNPQLDLFPPRLVYIDGCAYEIADVGLRMLAPHELFAAQGFPADYVIDFEHNGKRVTKTEQVELAGNAVCPPVAHALVAANVRGFA